LQWDYANEDDEARLADKIRPALPRLRHKPYGRRIQTRVQDRDKRLGISTSGQMTPTEASSPQQMPLNAGNLVSSLQHHMQSQGSSRMMSSQPSNLNGLGHYASQSTYGVGSNFGAGPSHRFSNAPMANFNQYQGQGPAQQYSSYAGGPQHGMHYF